MAKSRSMTSYQDKSGNAVKSNNRLLSHSVGKRSPAAVIESGHLAEDTLRAYAMLDIVGDAVLSTDTETKITYMNRKAEALTGCSSGAAIGRPLHEIFKIIEVENRLPGRDLARQVMNTGLSVALHNSVLLITPDGHERAIEHSATPLYDGKKKIVGALILFHDSRYSFEMTAKMSYMAQHDSLTGLLNRYAFSEQFDQAAALARRHCKKMVMLFVDLDNFKKVNDTLGHTQGDAILKTLAHELLGCVRETDQVCRYGGDEFVILLSDIEQPEQAFAVVDKVREAASRLLDLNGERLSLQMSIGVSIYPDDGETLETLLPHADAAMYRVKADKKPQR